MKNPLACLFCAVLLLYPLTSAMADDAKARELRVSRLGDVEMNCGALSQEAVLMRDIIMTTEEIKDGSELKEHGVTAVGAVGSFLIGSVTGGVGLAAAGFLLDRSIEGEAEDADGVQDIAEQRRSLMVGIFNAKGCHGPIDHAMHDGIERDVATRVADVRPAAGNEYYPKPHYNE